MGSEGNTSLPPLRYGALGEDRVLKIKKVKRLAIVGMGLTILKFIQDNFKEGGWRKNEGDQVWGIGPTVYGIDCDMCWEMHDHQNIRNVWKADNNYMDGHGDRYLKDLKIPIIMPRAMPELPNSLEYPLTEVTQFTQETYLMNTMAYMLAYALTCGVEELYLYGTDFNYHGVDNIAEARRACVEYWLGIMRCKGVKVFFPPETSLCEIIERRSIGIYGYDECQPQFGDKNEVIEFINMDEFRNNRGALEAVKKVLPNKLDMKPEDVLALICSVMQLSPGAVKKHLETLAK